MHFELPRERIFAVDTVDVRLDPGQHPFAVEHEAAIADNWRVEKLANPALFDGEVVLLSALKFADGLLEGRCHAVRYSTFLFWRKNRITGVAEHCFAHPVLVSRDNVLIAARMGPHTANAGRVYFAAGSFEPEDFRAGKADLHYNMVREVAEETGLDIENVPRDARYHAYSGNGGTAIFRCYRLDQTADDIARHIERFIVSESDPEITGPVLIRGPEDLPEGLMPHMQPIINWHFSA